jgi:hypothetical protein
MKKHLAIIFALAVVLGLGLLLVVVQGQGPVDEGLAGQGEIGVSGLAGDPPAGWEVVYMFTGVYNKPVDPEYATVVHCTNIGEGTTSIEVEFFKRISGFAADVTADVSKNDTQTFSTQTIASMPQAASAGADGTEDGIEHGSGRVLALEGSEIICTVQVLALDSSDAPTDMTKLHLFDSEGNLIDPDPDPEPGPGSNEGIFMPIIFKNS